MATYTQSAPSDHSKEDEKSLDQYATREVHPQDLEVSHQKRLQPNEGYDPLFVKKCMRKVDWRLVPILGAL